MLSALSMKLLLCFLAATLANSLPVSENASDAQKESKTTLIDDKLSPIQQPVAEETEYVEVQEDKIPEGAMVMMVEEVEDPNNPDEVLKTASNIVFRPLFRYHQKQESIARRRVGNRRIRRRYYMPRRSYRHAYRPRVRVPFKALVF